MHPILRNVLAVIAGLVVGSLVNMFFINISAFVIPPPNGADVTTTAGLQATIHLFEPKHFIFPFLAHASGTLVGAFLAAKLASTNTLQFALVIGLFFLIGGVATIFMLPSPLWFNILDLVAAYIPMAYIGWLLAKKTVA